VRDPPAVGAGLGVGLEVLLGRPVVEVEDDVLRDAAAGVVTELGGAVAAEGGKEDAMPTSTLTSKGQVTIPKKIRERLGLRVGTRLEFRIDAQGKLVVEPEVSGRLGRVPGLLHHLAGERPVSVEEMDESIRRHVRRRHDEAVRG
jgi:AbrB family looped-hinge helix DNA binding protein